MARYTSIAAILAATILLLAATNAYACKTTISAVEIDKATNKNPQQSCREEIQSKQPWSCGLYITRSPLRIAYQTMCCAEMKRLEDECQCEALEELIRQVKVQAEGAVDLQDVIMRAENVPVYCNLQQRCKFQSVSL